MKHILRLRNKFVLFSPQKFSIFEKICTSISVVIGSLMLLDALLVEPVELPTTLGVAALALVGLLIP